ncbi:hypothetical protein LY78DRAFT_471291 [Colletotrichum sublineola]|nr:hypothetical protein LY78DRAFT_471291 [Colletotrichum sublineola]
MVCHAAASRACPARKQALHLKVRTHFRFPIGVSFCMRESSGTPVRGVGNQQRPSRHYLPLPRPLVPSQVRQTSGDHRSSGFVNTTIFLVRFNHQQETLSWPFIFPKKPDFPNPPQTSAGANDPNYITSSSRLATAFLPLFSFFQEPLKSRIASQSKCDGVVPSLGSNNSSRSSSTAAPGSVNKRPKTVFSVSY